MYTLKEYNEDCKTLDKLNLVLSTLEIPNNNLFKKADITSTIKELATSIYNSVKSEIDEKGIYVVLDYLSTGFLMRFGITGMIIAGILTALGINLSDIAKYIVDALSNHKGVFTRADALKIADEATSQKIGTASSLEYFHGLRKNGQLNEFKHLIKESWSETKKNPYEQSFWDNFKVENLRKLIESKPGLKTKTGGGIVRWLIATILFGFVGREVTKLVQRNIPGINGSGSTDNVESNKNNPENTISKPPVSILNFPTTKSKLKHSNIGLQYFINDADTSWYINIINGDLDNTLVLWATEIYPELKGHEDLIRQSPSFNKMVSILSRNYNGGKYLQIPPSNLHTWTDIVNVFVPEVEAKLQKGTDEK